MLLLLMVNIYLIYCLLLIHILDGYFLTGDIVEMRGEELVLIDRKKNFFKLSNGKFVRVLSSFCKFKLFFKLTQIYFL